MFLNLHAEIIIKKRFNGKWMVAHLHLASFRNEQKEDAGNETKWSLKFKDPHMPFYRV